jgi:cytochrome d ubiquinol oxidase subunit II
LLNPYALLVGLTGLAAFVSIGASWAAFKTEGALQERAARARSWAQAVLVVLLVLTTVYTALDSATKTQLSDGLSRAMGWVGVALLVAGLGYGRWAMVAKKDGEAFVGAMTTIFGLMAIGEAGLYPDLVRSLDAGAQAVTIHNASSSHLTLTVMLVFALVALPVVIAYQVYVQRIFSGRVGLEDVEY